jgi:hypothetical protein
MTIKKKIGVLQIATAPASFPEGQAPEALER